MKKLAFFLALVMIITTLTGAFADSKFLGSQGNEATFETPCLHIWTPF